MSRNPRHRLDSAPTYLSRRSVLTGSAALALTATGLIEVFTSDPEPPVSASNALLLDRPADRPVQTLDELLPQKPLARRTPTTTRGLVRRPLRKPKPHTSPRPKATSNRRAILRTARSLFGVPYLWGGNTPRTGLDCSGYTRWVFARNGLSLPRNSAAQRAYCRHTTSPIPGDLVFFQNAAGRTHHVGIYIGNDRMYDSPHTGSVVGEHSIYPGHVFGRHPRL